MRIPGTTFCLMLMFSGAAGAQAGRSAAEGATGRAVGVSPGSAASFVPAAGDCPTFSWTEAEGASAYELRVFRVGDLELAEALPALTAELPAGASGWTPPGDRCLEAGERYAWSIRALAARQGAAGQWSEALLFEIAKAPTASELQRALEVVQRYLGTARVGEQLLGEAAADILPTRAVAATESPRLPAERNETHHVPVGGGPATAVRGEVPDGAGETYGVRGVSNSPDGAGVRADNNNASGPDLVLGGSPVAELTETGLSRDSAGNLNFNFTNPGAGTMTLQVDGTAVLTAATDDWVNETGDAMSGLLTLDPAAGFALQTGIGDAINLQGNLFKDGLLFLHDTGTANTAVGENALLANTTGSENAAVGYRALDANTTGTQNTAVGSNALGSNTTGNGNTALGRLALSTNTTGVGSTALGYRALSDNTASSNTAAGANALRTNSTGTGNTAVGRDALVANTTASGNTAVGYGALDANTTGFDNVALGRAALGANTAFGNTAVGAYALDANTTGIDNVALGRGALGANTTGFENIAIGEFAGFLLTTGSSNITIGSDGVAGESNTIRIGGESQTRAFIDGIHGVTVAGGTAVFIKADGQLGTSTSSRRFKEEIEDLEGASERLLALRPVSFRYTEEAAGEGERPLEYGLIAEEVAEVFPELVVFDEEGQPYTVRYHLLTPMLLNELQRLTARFGRQEEVLAGQHAEIHALRAALSDLARRVRSVLADHQGTGPPERAAPR